jgi:hypothetical protein
MTERLDLPALGAFLRSTVPASQPPVPQRLDASLWLELLAAVLGCSPGWLLESRRVSTDDLEMRGRISDAARLIRSHDWPPPEQAVPAQLSPSLANDLSPTAAVPDAWLAARNAYLNHVMACRACRAHLPKSPTHCPTGAELREQYDRQTTQYITSERTQEGQHA